MIFVTDKGQLCNNIFQYGHLYAWGREHGKQTVSMRFAHKYPEFRIAHLPYHNTFVYLTVKLAAKAGLISTVCFNDLRGSYALQEQTMLTHSHILVTGWCVRYFDLFEKYKKEIVNLFSFSMKVERTVAKRFASVAAGVIRLGIHVRRGDYASWCSGRYFYEDSQYVAVAKQFCQLFSGQSIKIYICGNDRNMDCGMYERELAPASVYFPCGTPAEDLCLLSHCDYLIGPPSTFSLVATMYHDARLYWMVDVGAQLSLSAFDTFDTLSRRFDDLYIPG